MNLQTLKLSPNSYVDEILTAYSSDILYEVEQKDGKRAYLYLLIEHQSSIDPLMPFRVLNYMVQIWNDFIKQTGSYKLPVIYQLVFYHGKTPYNGSRNIFELIDAPLELIEKILFKNLHIVDMHDITDETLREHKWAGILEFVCKHIFT